jgi:ABC-type polysaccharide/polyol phosphate export permease
MLAALFVGLTALTIGWRAETGALTVLGGFGVAVFFSYALTWMNACLGMSVKSPEAAQGIVFVIMFPLAFLSNVFSPTQGMPSWVAAIANWNPVSAVAAACRTLFGNPNPSATVEAWPMQHPVLASLAWSVAILLICVPLAGWLYRRRTAR